VLDPAALTSYELSARIERLMTTLGERLTHLDREVLREAVRRAGEREGVVEALLDRNLQWGAQLERNRLLEGVAEAALAYRQGDREAGRRLDAALGLCQSPCAQGHSIARETRPLIPPSRSARQRRPAQADSCPPGPRPFGSPPPSGTRTALPQWAQGT
jgi:hypothetical protein